MSFVEIEKIPRRTMILFFLIDTSGSMYGSKIDAANKAIRDVLPVVQKISDDNPDAQIKIAAMQFDDNVRWITDEPKSLESFSWVDLGVTGCTEFGSACEALNEKLSRNQFMKSDGGYYAPAIILLSDGYPTDEYSVGLSTLKQNNWFKSAIRLAIAIGDEVDMDVLTEFAGTSEGVYKVYNPQQLERLIHLVTVTSSTIGSVSSTAGDESKQEQVISEINKQIETADPSSKSNEWGDW